MFNAFCFLVAKWYDMTLLGVMHTYLHHSNQILMLGEYWICKNFFTYHQCYGTIKLLLIIWVNVETYYVLLNHWPSMCSNAISFAYNEIQIRPKMESIQIPLFAKYKNIRIYDNFFWPSRNSKNHTSQCVSAVIQR